MEKKLKLNEKKYLTISGKKKSKYLNNKKLYTKYTHKFIKIGFFLR
jgi:hypothetical protein